MAALARIIFAQVVLRWLFRRADKPVDDAPRSDRIHCYNCNSDWKPDNKTCPACRSPLY